MDGGCTSLKDSHTNHIMERRVVDTEVVMVEVMVEDTVVDMAVERRKDI